MISKPKFGHILNSKATLAQICFLPIVGLSQIFFMALLHHNLTAEEFGFAALILTAPLISQFLDFGNFYLSFVSFSSLSKDRAAAMQGVLTSLYSTCTIAIVGIAITTTFFLCFHFHKIVYAVLLLLFVNLPAAWTVGAFRGLGQNLIYVVIFNSSWPISLLVAQFLIYTRLLNGVALSLIPILSSILIGLLTIPYLIKSYRRQHGKMHAKIERNNFISHLKMMVIASLNNIATSLAAFGDKYLVGIFWGTTFAGVYIAHSQITLGLISVLTIYFVEELGKSLSGSESQSSISKFVSIGFLLSISNLLLINIGMKLLYDNNFFDLTLATTLSIMPCFQSIIYGLQTKIATNNFLIRRATGSMLHFTVFSLLILMGRHSKTVWLIPLYWSFGAIVAIAFLNKQKFVNENLLDIPSK